MSFNDLLEKHENSQGPAVDELTLEPTTESVPAEEVVPETKEPEAEKPTTEPAKAEEVKPVTQEQQPDYNKFLEESSEGLFKSVDDLKTNLIKVKEYDTLKQQRDELEAKTKEDPFANPFVKKYNDLVKSGKTKDQIDSFVRINQLGDLTQLSPFELKVEALVQDGYKREFAERKVTKDFGLNIELEGEHLSEDDIANNKQELAYNQEELRISAQSDLSKLQELKVKLEDTTSDVADNKALAEVALNKEYQAKLAPITKDIATQYTGIGQLNINGKEGEQAKLMNFEADPEFKQEIEQRVFDYFKDGSTPVNAETVAEVKSYLDAVSIARNKEKFAQTIYNQGYADAKEAADAEYENKSGLHSSGKAPITMGAADALREQQKRAAKGEDD